MMDDVAGFEEIGEQFRFLLQPVRDLSKNWDIDIKHYLEDYLNKLTLEHGDELDDCGKRKIFNFAEAAVVIGGSTNIYSRKVDYLLQQAQDCLTQISVGGEKKRKRRVPGEEGVEGGDGGADGDAGDGFGGDGDEAEGEEDIEDPDERRRRTNPYLKPITHEIEEQMRAQLQKLSKKRPCFPIVPLAFTPLTDFEKCDVVLYHRKKDSATNLKVLEMVGKKDDFKVNTCQIIDGVALIDLKNSELLEMFTQPNMDPFHTPSTRSSATDARDSFATITTCSQFDVRSSAGVGHPDEMDIGENMENIDPLGCDFFDFSNDDLAVEYKDTSSVNSTQPKGDFVRTDSTQSSASVSYEGHQSNELLPDSQRTTLASINHDNLDGDFYRNSLEEFNQNNNNPENSCVDGRTQHSSVGFSGVLSSLEYDRDSAPYNLRAQLSTGSDQNLNVSMDRKALAAALAEPFEPLDPMEVRNNRSKPFRLDKKCTTVAEKQVKQRDRRIAKECLAKGVPNISTVKNYIDTRIFGQKIRKRSHVFSQFNSLLMDQALLSLSAQFYAEEERRAAIRKQREEEAKMARRLARRTSQRTSAAAAFHKESIARASTAFGAPHSPPRYEDPVDELGADDCIDYGFEPDYPEDRPLGDVLSVDDLGDQNFAPPRTEDLNLSRRRSALIRNDNIYDDTIYMGPSVDYPDDLPPRPLSQLEYNELVEYHLKKYWTIKEEARTKFCERVREWEERVNPLLEEELSHRQFNTREYMTDFIEGFQQGLGSEIDFSQFAKNAVNYDLSRYLLISLMLTNTQNVKIVSTDVNQLHLQLLKLERHHEVFEDEEHLITGV